MEQWAGGWADWGDCDGAIGCGDAGLCGTVERARLATSAHCTMRSEAAIDSTAKAADNELFCVKPPWSVLRVFCIRRMKNSWPGIYRPRLCDLACLRISPRPVLSLCAPPTTTTHELRAAHVARTHSHAVSAQCLPPPAAMAHVLADSRPRFNSYPTAINTQYAPPSKQYAYHYTPATPATTPTKSHPTSSYPYRQATNPSQSRLAAAPVTQQSSSRPVPRSSSSVPIPRSAASVPVPAPRSTNPLPAAPEAYSHSRKTSVSRPSQSQPPADNYRPAKREEDRYASRSQSQQQYTDPAAARQARLIAERDATLKRMEARQRSAQAQTWFEEGQRLAAQEAARKQQQDEERRRAEEKLRRAAEAQAEEERKLHARKHERGRSQTHHPGVPSADGKKWYQGWFREKSRDGRGRKDDRSSDREQRGERERAKSEGRARDAKDARDRVEKDRARSNMSESAVAEAWTTYEKACAELMVREFGFSTHFSVADNRFQDAKPTKGKPLSSNLTFYDIPWPVLGTASSFHDLTTQNIAAFLLSPHHSSGKSRRARLRAAILIWHPDVSLSFLISNDVC